MKNYFHFFFFSEKAEVYFKPLMDRSVKKEAEIIPSMKICFWTKTGINFHKFYPPADMIPVWLTPRLPWRKLRNMRRSLFKVPITGLIAALRAILYLSFTLSRSGSSFGTCLSYLMVVTPTMFLLRDFNDFTNGGYGTFAQSCFLETFPEGMP